MTAADMRITLPAHRRTPVPLSCAHVMHAWHLLGGRVDWTQVLVVADLVGGDPELLVEGLVTVRDTVAAVEKERLDGLRSATGRA